MEQEIENTPNKIVNQDEILQAALKLFAEKGYFNTSLADIKEAAGLKSISVIYQFFKTKQAIAIALRENILDSFSISIDDIRRRNRKAADQLREIVDLLFRLTDEAPEIIQFMLFIKTSDFLPEQTALFETAAFNKIRKILQAGIKDGEIRALEPALAYSYFFGIVLQVLAMVLNKDLPKTADSYQTQVWMAAWGSIVKK
ncbi:TetR/AcrR family transcriptional regulator [Methylomonas paludis]|uniref:TetR/AcrR family transcriptional regulator n=1 Tax=Methylomonas paludis TaxID=1173101 RepID=A0A975MML3_9GAMM|nr:TetR/AcrR family transcriptional regulator [Methylomonas paludis]QWF70394.1 TetR/AcrR family transcriptional regulator [Methylomonas paludis]